MRRGSCVRDRRVVQGSFLFFPVLRRGSLTGRYTAHTILFLFFPVLRRGSTVPVRPVQSYCFYSSPSCDGDLSSILFPSGGAVSILPRLATGIMRWNLFLMLLRCFYSSPSCDGDLSCYDFDPNNKGFYSSPSCDGDPFKLYFCRYSRVSILPRLATGIVVWKEISCS